MVETGAQPDAWDGLEAAVARFRARARAGRSGEELGTDVKRLRHLIDQLELEFAMVTGAFAATDQYERDGCDSPMMWIRHESKVSGRVASDALAVAEQQAALPQSVAAVNASRIGFGHLALLAHTAAAVTASPTAGRFDEGPLLRQAQRHTVSRFQRDCRDARHAADTAAFLAEHVDTVEARFLEVSSRDDGCVWLRGFLDSVGGASLRTVLESLGRREGADDGRSRDRRMADALVELAEHALYRDQGEAGRTRAPQLMVTASLETLAGVTGAAAADLQFAGAVPGETARRLACDANIVALAMDREARVAGVGRSRRMPNTATRRRLALRDGGCVWPGCERPASWTVPHHLVHWAGGGDHELENLVLLCARHHWKVHEGGWELVVTEERRVLTVGPRSDVPRARPPTPSAA